VSVRDDPVVPFTTLLIGVHVHRNPPQVGQVVKQLVADLLGDLVTSKKRT
jgi:hypothetical protein